MRKILVKFFCFSQLKLLRQSYNLENRIAKRIIVTVENHISTRNFFSIHFSRNIGSTYMRYLQ